MCLRWPSRVPGRVLRSDEQAGALDGEHGGRPESAKVSFMQVWLKLLIVWFIAIALPVQGMAGVTRAHCGPSHGRMGAAMEASPHQHMDHDADAAHHHDADAADGAGAADVADVATLAGHDTATQAKAQAGQLADPAQYKCSSCAACCAGSALPSAAPRLPQAKAAPAVFAEEPVTVDAFASDGPDRPPRSHFV